MIFYNFLTPGIFLILAAVLLNLIPKKFYKVSAIIFVILSYLVLCIGINKWNFYWYEQFMFSDERILFILTSIFFLVLFISLPIAFCEKNQSPHNISLLFLYVGATISILFTKNLLCILFFLEIMMLAATFIIFITKDKLSHKEGLNYFKFHMLGGTLLLVGIMSYYFKYDTFEISLFDKNNFYNFSALLILLGLLVNLAVPPFSSWLLGGYAVVSSYTSIIFAVCTTKISALLIMQLFAGWSSLIFIGIVTSIYGVIYSIFENNIKRTVLYIIIAELGMLLIFIGAGDTMNAALIAIINDLLCIPTILCSTHFIIHFFRKEKITEMKNISNNTKLVVFLNSIALLSIAALPFTLGYISKKHLYSSNYFINTHWLPYIVNLISGGIIFAVCFKFVVFGFFKNSSFKQLTESEERKLNSQEYYSYVLALAALYIGLLGLTIYFTQILGTVFVRLDGFLLEQIQHVLIVGIIFFLSRKYFIYNQNMKRLDPNILYLNVGKKSYKHFTNKMLYFNMAAVNIINSWLWSIQIGIFRWIENVAMLTKSIGWIIALAVIFFLIALVYQN